MMARRDMGLVYCNPLVNGRRNRNGAACLADRGPDRTGSARPSRFIDCVNSADRLLWPNLLA